MRTNNENEKPRRVVEIIDGVTRNPAYRLAAPIHLCICEGEQLAIVGPNGGGKSLLVDMLIGRHPLLGDEVRYDFGPSSSRLASENIKYITFRDSYGEADNHYYYQQRWNSQDIASSPLVHDSLPTAGVDALLRDRLYTFFGMDTLLDKHMVFLSSGELRRFQLVRTLLSGPRLLVLDNPFIGLDARTRDLLRTLLEQLVEHTNLQLVLVLSKEDEIPSFVTHVVSVSGRLCGPKLTRTAYIAQQPLIPPHVLPEAKAELIRSLPEKSDVYAPVSGHVIDLHRVSIRYGIRMILEDLDWTVLDGERWALSGENGAGKSTLLSLVCADNPQSYACDIALFGRLRGSGECIWDVKKHIGYVSPEMHRAYRKNLPAIAIVASGLHDSIGLYRRMRSEDVAQCLWWMDIFGISDLCERDFMQLSSGEQRLVLLARAFVKDPELLILDEPLHGLDLKNRRMVKDIIEAFCLRRHKTLVMVTHYEEELPSVIDHRLCLKKHV